MEAVQLRPYQSIAVHQVFDAWRAGNRSVVLVAPTGMGKRVIALWLMEYAAKAGRRVLFVGNRRLLITQAKDDAERYGIDYGTIMADAETGNPASTNQLASIQTLESWYFYEKFTAEATGRGLPPADLLVIDEGHQDIARVSSFLRFIRWRRSWCSLQPQSEQKANQSCRRLTRSWSSRSSIRSS